MHTSVQLTNEYTLCFQRLQQWHSSQITECKLLRGLRGEQESCLPLTSMIDPLLGDHRQPEKRTKRSTTIKTVLQITDFYFLFPPHIKAALTKCTLLCSIGTCYFFITLTFLLEYISILGHNCLRSTLVCILHNVTGCSRSVCIFGILHWTCCLWLGLTKSVSGTIMCMVVCMVVWVLELTERNNSRGGHLDLEETFSGSSFS